MKEAELTRRAPSLDLKDLPIEDLLTSELCLLAGGHNANSAYRQELERRLDLLGLSNEQKQKFISIDEEAIQKKDPHVRLEGIGVSCYFSASTTIENLPAPDTCLTSELIAIIDDANAAWIRDHEWLPDSAFAAVGHASVRSGQSPYNDELQRRFETMGLSKEQLGLFVKNECLISEREKWGYNPSQMSWDKANFNK